MENKMGNGLLLDKLKNHLFVSFSMLEKVIEICPDEIWNKKISGFIFWQQILHTIYFGHFWLRDENNEFNDPFKNKNIYPELEKDPENVLTKEELKNYIYELKEIVEKWLLSKDDNWLKKIFFSKPPHESLDKATNFDIIMNQIKHFDYHIGHCESIFRNFNIDPKEYFEYYGNGIIYLP
jgi:hypothetical protein